MKHWKSWELETKTAEYQFSHGKSTNKILIYSQNAIYTNSELWEWIGRS